MTLILSRASKDYVIQVTDRRITQTAEKVVDEISNKNVLYCAQTALWRSATPDSLILTECQ